MVAIRSVSFTRSSRALRTTRSPSDKAPGYGENGDFINQVGDFLRQKCGTVEGAGAVDGDVSVGFPGIFRRGFHKSMCAPMRRRALMTAQRVSLRPTWRSVRREPGRVAAATIQKAAEEMSAGPSGRGRGEGRGLPC